MQNVSTQFTEVESDPTLTEVLERTHKKKSFPPDTMRGPMRPPRPTGMVRPRAPVMQKTPTAATQPQQSSESKTRPVAKQMAPVMSNPFGSPPEDVAPTEEQEESKEVPHHEQEVVHRQVEEPKKEIFVIPTPDPMPTPIPAKKVEDTQKTEKPKEISKNPGEQPQEEQAGFFGRLNSLIGFITRRRQGYTGKPASAMYWDDKKGRYVINGEDDSSDDEPPPPPPAKKASPVIETAAEQEQATGLSSLTTPGFSGALANRGKGRGRGKPVAATNRFPQSFPQVAEESKPTESSDDAFNKTADETVFMDSVQNTTLENVPEELYTTTLDQSQDVSVFIANEKQSRIENEEREAMWQQRDTKQNDKIAQLRYQVSQMQKELQTEKDTMRSTIENLEQFTTELKQEGDKFEAQISLLKRSLKEATNKRAKLEFDAFRSQEELTLVTAEYECLREQNKSLKGELLQVEFKLDRTILKSHVFGDQKSLNTQIASLQRELFETRAKVSTLEFERESLLWQKTELETQNLLLLSEKSDKLQGLVEAKSQFEENLAEIELLREQLQEKHDQDEAHKSAKAGSLQTEKERDNLKDLVTKLQTEKERLAEQVRERLDERDRTIKKLESEKSVQFQEFQRQIREFESASHQRQRENKALMLSEQEKVGSLLQQNQALQEQLKTQQQRQQQEGLKTEKTIRSQLSSLEQMLSKRDADLMNLETRNEEQTQELQTMGLMRSKLNEHVVYLQNELRKRDELLDSDSDFDCTSLALNDSGFNINQQEETETPACSVQSSARKDRRSKRKTSKHLVQQQLDESRQLLREQIEAKLRAEQHKSQLEERVLKLCEGLQDIKALLAKQVGSAEGLDEEDEQLVNSVVALVFKVQNLNEERVLELQHLLDMSRLEQEDVETFKFDLEIVQEEKSLLDQDLVLLREKLVQAQRLLQDSKHFAEKVSAETKAGLESKLAVQTQSLQREHQKTIEDLHSSYALKLEQNGIEVKHKFTQQINELKVKLVAATEYGKEFERQVANLQIEVDQSSKFQSELENLLNMQVAENTSLRSTYETDLHDHSDALAQAELQLREAIQKQSELQMDMHEQGEDFRSQLASLHAENEQLKESVQAFEELVTKRDADFDHLAQVFISKKKEYKQKLKEAKQQLRAANQFAKQASERIQTLELETELSTSQKATEQLTALKDQRQAELEQTDSLIAKMQSDAQQVIRQVKEKKDKRIALLETKLSEASENKAKLEQTLVSKQKEAQDSIRQITETKDAQISELEQQIAITKDLSSQNSSMLLVQAETEIKGLKAQLENCEERLAEAATELENARLNQESSAQLENALSELQSARSLQNQKEKDLQTLRESFEQEKALKDDEITNLKLQVEDFAKVEQTYQEESQKLATAFKENKQAQKGKLASMKSQLKSVTKQREQLDVRVLELTEEMKELQARLASVQEELETVSERKTAAEMRLEHIEGEKSRLAESLDLTRVECQQELSRLEEVRQLASEIEAKISAYQNLFLALLQKTGQSSDSTEERDFAWFEMMQSKLLDNLQNYFEEKRSLKKLIHEREEMTRNQQNLEFQIERLQAENQLLANRDQRGETGKLQKQIKLLEEERNEIKNDFCLKFSSFNDEISVLKDRLGKYEEVEDESESTQPGQNTSGVRSMLASLFLTESEQKSKV